jgi:hypothetical protein
MFSFRLLPLALTLLLPTVVAAQQPEAERVRGTVIAVFDGMRAADSAAIRARFAPGGRFASVAASGDSVAYDSIDGWLRGVASSGGKWDEQVYDVEVHVDGGIAHVWAPYTFYLDGAVRHCGVNAVSLLRVGGAWRVTQWSDTRRREGCPDPLRRK